MNRYVRMALVAAVPALLIGLSVGPRGDPLGTAGLVIVLWAAWYVLIAALFIFIEMGEEP